MIASFTSYAVEKKLSKHPEKFGTGAIEGLAGPETANNAGASGAFVPLLTLGIPSSGIMALLLGFLLTQGVHTGPLLLKDHADIFWGRYHKYVHRQYNAAYSEPAHDRDMGKDS